MPNFVALVIGIGGIICTIIFDRSLRMLTKNRDKNVATQEEVVRGNSFVAIRTVDDEYFSCGVTTKGTLSLVLL